MQGQNRGTLMTSKGRRGRSTLTCRWKRHPWKMLSASTFAAHKYASGGDPARWGIRPRNQALAGEHVRTLVFTEPVGERKRDGGQKPAGLGPAGASASAGVGGGELNRLVLMLLPFKKIKIKKVCVLICE